MVDITSKFTPAASDRREKPTPEELMQDLWDVGRRKILGYLPLSTIRDICGLDPQQVKAELEARGLKALLMESSQCQIYSGALYAYDEKAMGAFLNQPQNAATLAAQNWPCDAEAFVRKTANDSARHETQKPLYDLIALAFHDHRYRDYKAPPQGPVPFRFG